MKAMGNMPQRQLSHRVKGSRVSQIIMKREVWLQVGKEGQADAFSMTLLLSKWGGCK